jgi:hypothetical protein
MATATKKKQTKKASGSSLGIVALFAGLLWWLTKKGGGGTDGARLIGTVLSGEDNTPVEGANVKIGNKITSTYQDGSFFLEELPTGTSTIAITATDYQDFSGSVALVAGDNVKTFQIFKKDTSAGLSGYVTDQNDGATLAGARITIGGKSAYADLEGAYTIAGLVAGPYSLMAELQWYKTKSLSVVLKVGTNTVNITMNSLGSVQGQVTDSVTHAVLSAAAVTCEGLQTLTNANGIYSLTLKGGNRTVTVSKTGYQTQSQAVTIEVDQIKTLSFLLVQEFAQAGVVQGVVANAANGNPIVGALLVFTPENKSVNSGVSGTYSIELPSNSFPGITYSVTVSAAGYYNAVGSVTVRTGTYNILNIPMTPLPVPKGAVHGYVKDKNTGFAIYGSRVDLNPTDLFDTTDGDGFFDIENVEPGAYEIWANKDGYVQQVKSIIVNSNQVTNVELLLPPVGAAIGFFMSIEFDPSNYPSAALWYADVANLYNWFISVNNMWDGSKIDLSTRTWPAQLTVELYDAALNRLVRKVKSVTMQNGRIYAFYVEQNQLVDMGPM